MGMVPNASVLSNWEPSDSPLSWGRTEAPLLPTSLRRLWYTEELPTWVRQELSLPESATMSALDASAVPPTGASDRIRNFLSFVVGTRIEAIRPIIVVDRPWPAQLSAQQVPWKLRTRNCLSKTRVADKLADLPKLSFGDLFEVRGMGARSVLDFACTLEAALDTVDKLSGVAFPDDDKAIAISRVLNAVLEEPWADWVSERDPRFADLLPAGSGTVTERIDSLTSNPTASGADLEALAMAVDRIRARIGQLASDPLEKQLSDYVSMVFRLQDRRLPAMIARLHLGGDSASKTLEEAGTIAGVTRERMRQIEARGKKRHPPHPIVMPGLDDALEAVLGASPIDVSAAGDLVLAAGLTRKPFHPASLIAAAELCGRTPPIEIQRVYDRMLVVRTSADRDAIARVIRLARRQAGQAGASSIAQVVEAVNRDGLDVSESRAADVIRVYAGAEFLNNDWFCFPLSPGDVVRNLSRKMLSVTTPLAVSSLREGIRRHFRFRHSSGTGNPLPAVPPREVLAGYYRAHPDFAIDAAFCVRSVIPLDYRAELVGVEMVMATVLKASPARMLDRATLAEQCTERGVNIHSLWTLASYSPIMENLGGGLWTLRGTVVDPAAVEAFRRQNALRPRERRVVDHGWLPTGELWVAIRIPEYWQVFMFPVPADISRFVAEREFNATDTGNSFGRIIRVHDNRVNGIHPFLKQAGADVGDILLLRFDLSAGSAIVSIIDDETLEEMNPEP